jgi:hypothetical protein
MFSGKSKTVLRVFVSFLLILAGSAYLLYLQVIFPKLVPGYGGGERFTLSEANNFTFQIPWSARSRLHLTLQANGTVELYRDGDYVCDCSSYEFVIEGGDEAHILLKSNSSVSGMFTARQEIPVEKRLLAFIIILAGLIGVVLSIRTHNRGETVPDVDG